MTDVANVLRDHGNLLLAITTVLGKIETRMAEHEEAASERSIKLARLLASDTLKHDTTPEEGTG